LQSFDCGKINNLRRYIVKNDISKKLSKTIAKIALTITKANVNSTCPYHVYQPKIPEAAKKLRKF
jgi:cyclic lactone autoinducer peptide